MPLHQDAISPVLSLEEHLQRWHDANHIAVSERDRDWSYRDLFSHVQWAASYFRRHGISRVMVCLPQGFHAYTIIWGAYLAGTAFCPTTTGTPPDRLSYYADQFKPDLVLSEQTDSVSLSILEFFERAKQDPMTGPSHIDGATIAYVIFTSGSTGVPKGVMISRGALENVICWSLSEYHVSKADIWGQYSSLGFDLSILDIFTALASGATLVPYQTAGDKLLPAALMRKKRITIWHSVPSVVDLMTRAKHLDKDTMSSLRTVIFCGEKLFPNQLEHLFAEATNLVIYNTYGPTETTILCSFVRLTKDNYSQYCESTVSIGVPLPNTDLALEDPVDGIGELVISGTNVGIGYLEDRGASGYRTHMCGDLPTRRYHTGDYCRKSNGNLFFECRKDSQVKILGNRVDLSEIDYQLRCLGCSAATTIYHNNELIAFAVCGSLVPEVIVERLRQKLPAYYIPHRTISLEAMPYNTNGKVAVAELLRYLENP